MREKGRLNKEQINVWLLANQVRDMEKLKISIGKTKTQIVTEALGIYLNLLHRQGVL
jgi:hypothetical protein